MVATWVSAPQGTSPSQSGVVPSWCSPHAEAAWGLTADAICLTRRLMDTSPSIPWFTTPFSCRPGD